MTREEKDLFIDTLAEKLENSDNVYLTDVSGLPVRDSNELRRLFFREGVKMQVVKNSLLKKAMEKTGTNFEEAYEVLKGNTALVFSEKANLPAKIIKTFRKKFDRPILKAAFVDSEFYLGDEQIETLAMLKSRTELIGDIIELLQSPAKNVISALKSSSSKISGILKTLGDRPATSDSVSVEDANVESLDKESGESKADLEAKTDAAEELKEDEEVAEETEDNSNEEAADMSEGEADESSKS